MTDTRSPEQRRRIMQSVKTRDTGPEVSIRRALHRLGYRYRLHVKDLPGSPDLVFPARRKVIFVHGCFWHGHECPKGNLPKSRLEYWGPKIAKNKERDSRNAKQLEELGWKSTVVWQCDLKDEKAVQKRLVRYLGRSKKFRSTFRTRKVN